MLSPTLAVMPWGGGPADPHSPNIQHSPPFTYYDALWMPTPPPAPAFVFHVGPPDGPLLCCSSMPCTNAASPQQNAYRSIGPLRVVTTYDQCCSSCCAPHAFPLCPRGPPVTCTPPDASTRRLLAGPQNSWQLPLPRALKVRHAGALLACSTFAAGPPGLPCWALLACSTSAAGPPGLPCWALPVRPSRQASAPHLQTEARLLGRQFHHTGCQSQLRAHNTNVCEKNLVRNKTGP